MRCFSSSFHGVHFWNRVFFSFVDVGRRLQEGSFECCDRDATEASRKEENEVGEGDVAQGPEGDGSGPKTRGK